MYYKYLQEIYVTYSNRYLLPHALRKITKENVEKEE